jgi:serine/threonine protein kinase
MDVSMPLSTGDQLGHYRIESMIGLGGMGEVYRALDTRLNREVAIKVLPESVADNPDRLARFEREAKVLAQFNHSGIAAIYGVEDRALVMELVPGPTLADRIEQGPIPPEEAVTILSQIAEALEYAHERGVIHRDLKPANIKIDPDDKVKILDFGLAKALSDPMTSGPAGDPADSPTVTIGGTNIGTILGTAAYMAPEQARGKKVDKRADIWAFAVVAWEMLTGERLFKGEDTVQVLSNVLQQAVDLEQVPPKFRKLLGRCLNRNVRDRLRDIGDARYLLGEENPSTGPPEAVAAPAERSRLPWAVAGALLAGLVAVSAVHFREKPPVAERVQFAVPLPERHSLRAWMSLSPDGRYLAFLSGESESATSLWLYSFSSSERKRLTDAFGYSQPFWSPDSRFLAFQEGGKLKRIDIAGGSPETICDDNSHFGGGAWGPDDSILLGSEKGILRVAAAGGTPEPVTLVDASKKETLHSHPYFLPDGEHFVYVRNFFDSDQSGIYIASLKTPPEKQSTRRIVVSGYGAAFLPEKTAIGGRLLFWRGRALMAQPIDPKTGALKGESTRVAEPISGNVAAGNAFFSVAGIVLAYERSGGSRQQRIVWVDRSGKEAGELPVEGEAQDVALSPDGKRVALTRAGADGNSDIWILDVARRASSQLTFGPNLNSDPVWSPDGRRIVYQSVRDGVGYVYSKAADGSAGEERVLKNRTTVTPNDWSRDGFLVYTAQDPQSQFSLWATPASSIAGQGQVSFARGLVGHGQVSPDGRWIAYDGSESLRLLGVYVRPFPSGDAKWLVGPNGLEPRWSADGKELYYREGRKLWAVQIEPGKVFQFGSPKVLFEAELQGAGYYNRNSKYAPTPDGKGFLITTKERASSESSMITVVLNWESGGK